MVSSPKDIPSAALKFFARPVAGRLVGCVILNGTRVAIDSAYGIPSRYTESYKVLPKVGISDAHFDLRQGLVSDISAPGEVLSEVYDP